MILRMEAAKKLGDHALRGAAIPHYLAEIRRETSRVIADTGLRFVFLLFQAHSRRISWPQNQWDPRNVPVRSAPATFYQNEILQRPV
jgi:hypothetical protein